MKRTTITLKDIQNSACASRNPHLFGQHAKESKPKRNKYANTRVEIDGHAFDSKKEAKRYGELKLLQKAGKIGLLEMQVEFILLVNGDSVGSYVADFTYIDAVTGEKVVEDVKSGATRKIAKYRLKKKLMKQIYGIEIKEV